MVSALCRTKGRAIGDLTTVYRETAEIFPCFHKSFFCFLVATDG